jgi:hypothetical protein
MWECLRRIINHGGLPLKQLGETRRKRKKSYQYSVFSVYSVVKFLIFKKGVS